MGSSWALYKSRSLTPILEEDEQEASSDLDLAGGRRVPRRVRGRVGRSAASYWSAPTTLVAFRLVHCPRPFTTKTTTSTSPYQRDARPIVSCTSAYLETHNWCWRSMSQPQLDFCLQARSHTRPSVHARVAGSPSPSLLLADCMNIRRHQLIQRGGWPRVSNSDSSVIARTSSTSLKTQDLALAMQHSSATKRPSR